MQIHFGGSTHVLTRGLISLTLFMMGMLAGGASAQVIEATTIAKAELALKAVDTISNIIESNASDVRCAALNQVSGPTCDLEQNQSAAGGAFVAFCEPCVVGNGEDCLDEGDIVDIQNDCGFASAGAWAFENLFGSWSGQEAIAIASVFAIHPNQAVAIGHAQVDETARVKKRIAGGAAAGPGLDAPGDPIDVEFSLTPDHAEFRLESLDEGGSGSWSQVNTTVSLDGFPLFEGAVYLTADGQTAATGDYAGIPLFVGPNAGGNGYAAEMSCSGCFVHQQVFTLPEDQLYYLDVDHTVRQYTPEPGMAVTLLLGAAQLGWATRARRASRRRTHGGGQKMA